MSEKASVDPGKAIVDPGAIQGPCRADLAAWEALLDDWRPSCMGGWCHKRESCWLHVGPPRARTSERVCEPGPKLKHFTPIPIRQEHK